MEKLDHTSNTVKRMDEKIVRIYHIFSRFRILLESEKFVRVMEWVFQVFELPMLHRSEKLIKKLYSTI